MDNLEDENNNNIGEDKKPEIDLMDEEGHKEKLEVSSKQEEQVEGAEIITPKKESKKEEIFKEPKEKLSKRILNFYDKKYKKLMIIPVIIFILSVLIVGVQIAKTGSFIYKDVSLKGGVTVTIINEKPIGLVELESSLKSKFANNDILVESLKKGTKQIGAIVTADIDGTNKEQLDSFIKSLETGIGYELKAEEYSVEIMGSSLGASFFKEVFIAMVFAFILMSIVVMLYFRTFVPSLAVILCAFSDIIETLAVVNLMGMRISTGGIAAFLMLIGYSVDTDMLLTSRVLRRKEGTVFDRTMGAVGTGMMMTLTTLAALIVGIIFIESEVIKQIMIIVFIGLVFDIINTWIQNVGILRYYMEKKQAKVKHVL